MSNWLYRLHSVVVNAVGSFFHGFSVEGLENLPSPTTPVLFVSSHTSHVADAMLSTMYESRFPALGSGPLF